MDGEASDQDRSHPLSRDRGREFFDALFGEGRHSRLNKSDAQPLLTMDSDVDLRKSSTQSDLSRERPLRVVLAEGREFNLEPFLSGVPLGPLASLPVYTSDLNFSYVHRSHAPGLCYHCPSLGRHHVRILFDDWISELAAPGIKKRWSDSLCGKCGGFAIWRMSDDQLSFYRAAQRFERYEIPGELGRYESSE